MTKKFSLIFLFIFLSLSACSAQKDDNQNSRSSKKNNPTSDFGGNNSNLRILSGNIINLRVGNESFKINLYDNPTANDLYEKLPLTKTINNYGSWQEKIIHLNDIKLSMKNAPKGDTPLYPEVGYYQPGNWIAIYYGDIGYWPGKVPLGTINSTTEKIESIPVGIKIIIERIR